MHSSIFISCNVNRQDMNIFLRYLWQEIGSVLGKFSTMKFGSSAMEISSGLRSFIVSFSFEDIGCIDVYFYHHAANGLVNIEISNSSENTTAAHALESIICKALLDYKKIVPSRCIIELKMLNKVNLSGSYLFNGLLLMPTDEIFKLQTLKPITRFTGENVVKGNVHKIGITSNYHRQYNVTKCYVISEGFSNEDAIANAIEVAGNIGDLMSVLTSSNFTIPETMDDSIRIKKIGGREEGIAYLEQKFLNEKAGCFLEELADPIDPDDFYVDSKLILPSYAPALINWIMKEWPYLQEWRIDFMAAANAFNDAILMEDLPERWSLYSTLAAVTSLEAIMDNKTPERCPYCKQMIYGINKSFKELIQKYIHNDDIIKAFTDLYASRSKFVHEARRSYISGIRLADQPPFFLAEKNMVIVTSGYSHSKIYINYLEFTAYILRGWIKNKLHESQV